MSQGSGTWRRLLARAAKARGQSMRSQFLALASGAATAGSLLIGSALSETGGATPYIVFAASMGVLLPSFTILALKASERRSRDRLLLADVVSEDEQLQELYDRELVAISDLDVPPDLKVQLRFDAFQNYKLRQSALHGESRVPLLMSAEGRALSDDIVQSAVIQSDIKPLISGRGGSKN